MDLRLILITME